ncbi:MAG: helix-turn-helix domain-containing protein [Actinomycetota bacterium]|nr:helix-turn-helix domain-containing protein [Actinomycetota bacterium]
MAPGSRLRLARLARGMSQQDLAGAAGVSRQAVAGFESGQWDPSLRVALVLARSLGVNVEDLFGPQPEAPQLDAIPLAPLTPAPCRVDLGQVGPLLVALPLDGDRALQPGFSPAGGRAVPAGPARCRARPSAGLRPTLVVAGCDPALPLLRGPLGRLDRPVELLWWPCGSAEALRLAAGGLVHVAGFHVGADEPLSLPERSEMELVRFATWREGLASRPGLAHRVGGLADLAGTGLRLVNREPGAEARELLDSQLTLAGIDPEDVAGYDSSVAGHLLVASAVAAGTGDAGVTIEPAALAYGLDFTPFAEERSLLALPRFLLDTSEVQALLRVLATPAVQGQLAGLPGYTHIAHCGERVPGD